MVRLDRRKPGRNWSASPFPSYFTDPERAASGVRTTLEQGIVPGTTSWCSESQERTGRPRCRSTPPSSAIPPAACAGIFAAARDIGGAKILEKELPRAAGLQSRSLIESNIDALMTTDSLESSLTSTSRWCAITGHEARGAGWHALKTYFTDPKRAEDGIRLVLAQGQVTNYELTAHAKDGQGDGRLLQRHDVPRRRREDSRACSPRPATSPSKRSWSSSCGKQQAYNRGLDRSIG